VLLRNNDRWSARKLSHNRQLLFPQFLSSILCSLRKENQRGKPASNICGRSTHQENQRGKPLRGRSTHQENQRGKPASSICGRSTHQENSRRKPVNNLREEYASRRRKTLWPLFGEPYPGVRQHHLKQKNISWSGEKKSSSRDREKIC